MKCPKEKLPGVSCSHSWKTEVWPNPKPGVLTLSTSQDEDFNQAAQCHRTMPSYPESLHLMVGFLKGFQESVVCCALCYSPQSVLGKNSL